ncbi:hypothetical protein CTheo_7281 [Ceratobasidium theobromae]|uniref:Fungal lipase-type domain-containing protein n=1 Tax=Ceratobasidium theobromae TaxID=1582974 RepID=A0A5N5QCU7_9AGAM|nr:hypothetical protein CTheo_7281 [Ceratobasidium theobromae]
MFDPEQQDVFQKVLQLSIASNMIRYCKNNAKSLQDMLAEKLPGALTEYAGKGWEVVWGPAVWKHKGATKNMSPDNVWYVAKNPALEFEDGSTSCAYVVAIAGTAGTELMSYDWTHEDFNIGQVVDLLGWINGQGITKVPVPSIPIPGDGKVYTARGTTNAVHILAAAPPVDSSQSLCEFLQTIDAPAGSKLIFTGHSLGAALSPTLAVALTKAGYTSKFQGRTLVYPTGGATPGNDQFVDLFKELFPPLGTPSTYRVWNQNIVNRIDIVPQAWCLDPSVDLHLSNIPTLYGALPWLLNKTMRGGISIMEGYSRKSKIGYKPIPHSVFSGTPPSSPPKTFEQLVFVVEAQHLDEYGTFILGTNPHQPPLCKTFIEEEGYLWSSVLCCFEEAAKGKMDGIEPELRN